VERNRIFSLQSHGKAMEKDIIITIIILLLRQMAAEAHT